MATIEEWDLINLQAKRFLLMSDSERLKLMNNILDLAKDFRDKIIICFFYIYGMRPEELLRVVKSDFVIRENELMVRLPTVKRGDERVIVLDRTTPFIETIIRWVNMTPLADWKIFKEFTDPTNFNKACARLEKRYKDIYGESICLSPYVFRKFRISYLWSKGATSHEMLAWKGGKSIKVIEDSYGILKPVTKFKGEIK